MSTKKIWCLLLSLGVSTPFIQWFAGCGLISQVTDTLDGVNATMQQAVWMLETQSAQWQTTLKDLEAQLGRDAMLLEGQVAADLRQVIEQVDLVMKEGVQFGQESLNCQTDIFATRAKIAVQNLLNELLNKHQYKRKSNRPMLPYQPIVCSATPTQIGLQGWPGATQLVLSGIDFNGLDTQKPLAFIVRSGGMAERPVPAYHINRTTNYRMTVNVPNMITEGLFDQQSRQLVIRWEGRQVNPNEIPIVPMVPCGNLGQCCLPGSVCNSGYKCQGGVCVQPPCGGYGQPCCATNPQCTGNNRCVNNICTSPTPVSCNYTQDVSEEGGSPFTRCAADGFADGARCRGGDCDDMALHCCSPLLPAGNVSRSLSPWFSEEGSAQAISPTGFVSALRCRGGNCDDIQLEYVTHPRIRQERSSCQWTPYFSEEGPGTGTCPSGLYVAGMRCRGDNCDDVSLYCCRFTLLP